MPLLMSGGGGGGKRRLPILDDVLDYLTNMGGYTGFSEEMLKGDVELSDSTVNMDDFGKELETDDRVTTAFVLVLIAVPFIVGAIAFKLDIIGIPRFVPK